MPSEIGPDNNRMTIVQTRGQIGDPLQSPQSDACKEQQRDIREKVVTYEL